MTAIIFGAAGQDGFYLSQLLRRQQCEVVGVSRSEGFLRTDITDFDQVHELVKTHRSAYIFHFAANSTTRHDALFENHATIATGTLNILEAVKRSSPGTRVFISGSALQYRNDERPIGESAPFEARDPYSLSRIHSVFAARYYRTLGIRAYVGYFFNHDSPLRTERHMCKKISGAAKRIASGSKEKLTIGDLGAVKEWTFAGDTVNAVMALVNQDAVHEANIGSGEGHSIEVWLEECFSIAGLNWHDHVVKDESFVPEYRQLVSDPGLIFSLGWQPQISFHELAKMMMA